MVSTDFKLKAVVPRSRPITGTAVFRMEMSSPSMNMATATNHGSTRSTCGERVGAVCSGMVQRSLDLEPLALHRLSEGQQVVVRVEQRELFLAPRFGLQLAVGVKADSAVHP